MTRKGGDVKGLNERLKLNNPATVHTMKGLTPMYTAGVGHVPVSPEGDFVKGTPRDVMGILPKGSRVRK